MSLDDLPQEARRVAAEAAPAGLASGSADAWDAAAAMLDAVEREAPLDERLGALAGHVAGALGATSVAFVAPLAGQDLVVAAHGPRPAALPAGDGVRLVVEPAAARARAPRVADLAERLATRVVAQERAAGRAKRLDEVVTAVSHDVNDHLTPLLCHGCEPVVAESLRLRGLLETLRHLRGRMRPRDLLTVPAWLERTRRLLSTTGDGLSPVTVRCAPAAAARAVGPEQDQLLPMVMAAGLALRTDPDAARTGLSVGADLEAGRVVVELEATVERPGVLAALLDLKAAATVAPRLLLDGQRLRLRFELLVRPRVIVVGGAAGRAARVVLALDAAGIEGAPVPAAGALQAALTPPEPAAVLLLPGDGAAVGQLRRGLHRSVPALAVRCFALDETLAPKGYACGPDDLDLAKVLAAGADA